MRDRNYFWSRFSTQKLALQDFTDFIIDIFPDKLIPGAKKQHYHEFLPFYISSYCDLPTREEGRVLQALTALCIQQYYAAQQTQRENRFTFACEEILAALEIDKTNENTAMLWRSFDRLQAVSVSYFDDHSVAFDDLAVTLDLFGHEGSFQLLPGFSGICVDNKLERISFSLWSNAFELLRS
ncbi:hypothetical protein DN730_00225 [Marinomonas piezotolerans]|uniref:Uncharacterized protein n=1 Tax=Marinomonas piezotolerans TaxID=2213058 RepID=A0A370UCI8_9GAMM|nr:hypothetical protein [Marinomonas piezotolerans]RDL45516.1 hypothetical protein DN730_00225 [Marinomonas piezotolerans]